jgi:hypothetical protein
VFASLSFGAAEAAPLLGRVVLGTEGTKKKTKGDLDVLLPLVRLSNLAFEVHSQCLSCAALVPLCFFFFSLPAWICIWVVGLG